MPKGQLTAQELRDVAMALLLAQRYEDAIPYLDQALHRFPTDWELLHGMAMAVAATQGIDAARPHFESALRAKPNDARTLSALGLALYRAKLFEESKAIFFRATTADSNCEDAYVGLALAQRESGELEKSLHNLEAAAVAIARQVAIYVGAHNSRTSKVHPPRPLGRDLWRHHAVFGALYLCSIESGIDIAAWPTDQFAESEYQTRAHEGLYFVDTQNGTETTRLFLPNYFDSFREWLVGNSSYAAICLGTASVLKLLKREGEARDHAIEAEAFQREAASRRDR